MGKPDCVEPRSGRLAPELAAGFEPKLQDALDHPIRREVLRRLNGFREGCALPQLASGLAPVSIGQVNYHLLVLTRSDVVVRDSAELSVDGRASYESNLGADARVEKVLKVTEEWDREQREAAGRIVAALGRGPDDE